VKNTPFPFRIGIGYDIHQTQPGTEVRLGGVTIPKTKFSLRGHSDADVLIHAICDALLGAAALGDIGIHFPNTNPKYRGKNSLYFLQRVRDLIHTHGYQIGNIDSMLIAEAPKIAPYITRMKITLSRTLQIRPMAISVKATTNEGIGFIGRKEGIAAMAIAVVYTNAQG
jgi:2-C-methyl-D-erythritol 2,4-cyclodiphosphate synthase